MRTCKSCKEEKELEKFPTTKSRNGKIYRQHTCYACKRVKYKEVFNRYAMDAYYKDPEQANKKRAYYRALNKDINRLYNLNYYNSNKDKINITRKKYLSINKDKHKIWVTTRRDRKNNVYNDYNKNDYYNTKLLFSNMCFKCKNTKNLTLDHHYPLSYGFGLTTENCVILCKSCNSKKGTKMPNVFYTEHELYQIELILSCEGRLQA